MIMTGSMKFGR